MTVSDEPVLEMTVAYRCPKCMSLFNSLADYHAHRGICSLDEEWVGRYVSYRGDEGTVFGKVTSIFVDESDDGRSSYVTIGTLMAHARTNRNGCSVELVYEGTTQADGSLRKVGLEDVRLSIGDALGSAVSRIVEEVTGFGNEGGSE